MPKCDYSEDQFEDLFLLNLQSTHGIGIPHFKPSRVLEKCLGYDLAIETKHPRLASSGIFTDDDALIALHNVQKYAVIPHYFVTSFIQCKVPYLVSRIKRGHKQLERFWNGPYFKFDIRRRQNSLLCDLQDYLTNSAVVTYAAPCCRTYDEVAQYARAQEIVQQTHFVGPSHLDGHSIYSYSTPDGTGYACSDPTEVQPSSLLDRIGVCLEDAHSEYLFLHYNNTYLALLNVLLEYEDTTYVTAHLGHLAEAALGEIVDQPLDPLGRFSSTNLEWPGSSDSPTLRSFYIVCLGTEMLAEQFLRLRTMTFMRHQRQQ